MRLLNTRTLVIQEFPNEDELPHFAVLSHTWGKAGEECSFQDMTQPVPRASAKPGYKKIKLCCDQALRDGLEWAWVDTCCIDKTSTAELSEAINSMYRWYWKAKVCYAYLVDVPTDDDLASSKWFTRGWTLQELLAPRDVRFYSGSWQFLGSRLGLKKEIHFITGIGERVLASGRFDDICIAQKMSWAANRQTTRTEDRAYSLMGIFGVNMPLLYGEGQRAFLRLQEEILKTSDDHSLFAWGLPKELASMENFEVSRQRPEARELKSLFAQSPADFVSDHRLQHVITLQPDMPPIVSANGVHIRLPTWKRGQFTFAAISCVIEGNYQSYIGLVLYQWSQNCFARLKDSVLIPASDLHRTGLLIRAPAESELAPQLLPIFQISMAASTAPGVAFELIDVCSLPHAMYSKEHAILTLPDGPRQGPHAALIFRSLKDDKPDIWAVIVGGDATDGQTPWAVLVHILEEGEPTRTFYETPLALRRSTGSDLQSLLQDWLDWETLVEHGKQYIHQRLHYTRRLKRRAKNAAYFSRKERAVAYREAWETVEKPLPDYEDSAIDVKVQVANINIVERGIFVYISLNPADRGPDQIQHKDWWRFPGLVGLGSRAGS